MERVFLSRRNLETLLAKLDRTKAGDPSACTIVKTDMLHPKYPQTMAMIEVVALENEEYYTDRNPGRMHSKEETTLASRRS